MWKIAYRLLLLLAWPWVLVRLRWRARREPEYGERIGERFGRVPEAVPRGCVWFHTVSAGETIAAAPLIAELAERHAPMPFLVTTMTPTGSAQVRARLGDRVSHCYAPYDFPWAVRRFYQRVAPRLLVLMETELWPNLIDEAAARGVPVLLVNARLSERSARGYARLGGLTRRMLRQLRRVACQYPRHAERFVALGAPAERVLTHGSVKFDLELPEDRSERLASLTRSIPDSGAPTWIAGSTHAGEEVQLLAAHRRLREGFVGARLILAPRHPARADEVAALCRQAGLTVALLSTAAGGTLPRVDVILADTMGELLYLYALADVAFVGGSLIDHGGHNPIEPAIWGKPVLMGVSDYNFTEVVEEFRAAGALETISDAEALAATLKRWFDDRALASAIGARARAVVRANAGASARLGSLLEAELRALRR